MLDIGPGTLDLAPGSSVHVHFISPTTAATCGTVNNSASVTTANDGNPSVGPVPIVVNCASGALITQGVSLDPNGPFAPSLTTTPGTTYYNQVVVTNTGDVTLTGITLTDSLGLPGSCVVPGTLAPAATFTCTYSRVAAAGTTVSTTTVDSDQTGPSSASVTVTAAPAATPTPTPQVTVPPTDTLGASGPTGGDGQGAFFLLGLFLVSSGVIALGPRRRKARR